MSEIIQVLKEVQVIESIDRHIVTQTEKRVQVVAPINANVYLNTGAGAETPYKQAFVNTSAFTVLATTHGITEVKGVTLLDDQQIEMLSDVTINQSNQNVTVNFGVNQTGAIIIF